MKHKKAVADESGRVLHPIPIFSALRNGQLSLLALTVTPEVYEFYSETLFVPSKNPETEPTYPDTPTQYQIQLVN